MKKVGRTELFKEDRSQSDASVSLDAICDRLNIYGTADEVADKLLLFRDEVGDFGTLLYAGHDWADRDIARRSKVLMAEQVMPMVNAAIGRERVAAE